VESAEGSFRKIADVLRFSEKSSDAVRCKLSTLDNWLLIMDNADDPEHNIATYFPSGNKGAIIITNRAHEMCQLSLKIENLGAAEYQVENMEPEEALGLLQKASGIDLSDEQIRQDAIKLVNDLGYLALAIDQAGYIKTRKLTLRNYSEILQDRSRRFNVLNQPPTHQMVNYNKTVYSTWEMSFEMIKNDIKVGRLASKLLLLFSQMHYSLISQEIFRRASQEIARIRSKNRLMYDDWLSRRISKPILKMLMDRHNEVGDTQSFNDSIQLLRCYSFINIEDGGSQVSTIFSIHPLVHSWARERATCFTHKSQTRMQNTCTSLLAQSLGTTFRRSSGDMRFRLDVLVHIAASQKAKLGNFDCAYHGLENPYASGEVSLFTSVFLEHGQYQHAEILCQKLLKEQRKRYGALDVDTSSSENGLEKTARRFIYSSV
jgi:hypothetical protein